MKTDWSMMTWSEVRDAAKDDRVALVPLGCVETQGPYTPVGLEFLMAQRLAQDVAKRAGAVALPTVPFGNSNTFKPVPGTIYLPPPVLSAVYREVLMSVVRSGFRRILCLVYHIPNQSMISEAAREVREATGVSVVWLNPGALSTTFFRELFADPDTVRGHGAEPGASLARYLFRTTIPGDAGTGEKGKGQTYHGFDVNGAGLDFRGTPVGMPLTWDELYISGGYGDATQGSVEIGRRLYEAIVEHVVAVTKVVASMDVSTGVTGGQPVGAGR